MLSIEGIIGLINSDKGGVGSFLISWQAFHVFSDGYWG
jgi:hypothetical protein